jgi:hypothetical protein
MRHRIASESTIWLGAGKLTSAAVFCRLGRRSLRMRRRRGCRRARRLGPNGTDLVRHLLAERTELRIGAVRRGDQQGCERGTGAEPVCD